jgi:hypothetical protein
MQSELIIYYSMPILSQEKELLAFIRLTGASLAFVRDHCVWKGTIEKCCTQEEYERIRKVAMAAIGRSLRRHQRGSLKNKYTAVRDDFDYKSIISHPNIPDDIAVRHFPHRYLTKILYASQFPPTTQTMKSTQSNRSPPRQQGGRGKSPVPPVPKNVHTGSSVDEVSEGLTKCSITDNASLRVVDSSTYDDTEAYECEEGNENPESIKTFDVEGVIALSDGAKATATFLAIAVPLTGPSLNSSTVGYSSAELVKFQYEDGRVALAVLFTIPLDVSYEGNKGETNAISSTVAELIAGPRPKKVLGSRWGNVVVAVQRKIKKWCNKKGKRNVWARHVIVIPPAGEGTLVTGYDEYELDSVGEEIKYYSTNYIHESEQNSDCRNALVVKFCDHEQEIQVGTESLKIVGAHLVTALAIAGTEEQFTDPTARADVDEDDILKQRREGANAAAALDADEEDDEEEGNDSES